MTRDDLCRLPNGIMLRIKWIAKGIQSPILGTLTVRDGYHIQWDDGSPVSFSRKEVDGGTADEWIRSLEFDPPRDPVSITFSAILPPGYEATGEFRQPDPTVDIYVHQDGVTVVHPAPRGNGMPKGPRIILRKNQTAKERLQVLGENIAAHSMTPMHRIRPEIAEILNLMN